MHGYLWYNSKPARIHHMLRKNKLVSLYLKHLSIKAKAPTLEYLSELQKRHIEKIPHENIDGIFNIHTSFDIPHLLNKYIVENRGGLCFELNYSFGWLLHQLGFKVEILIANVLAYDDSIEINPYPTHPIIIVYVDNKKYLTDVGWGDAYRGPLSLDSSEYQNRTGVYRVMTREDQSMVMQKLRLKKPELVYEWRDQFEFNQPQGALAVYTYPKGFLASHAYTHVGKGYLFAERLQFSRVHAEGHRTLVEGLILSKEGLIKTKEEVKETNIALETECHVAPEIAKKCVKLKRSQSMLFLFKPMSEEELIERVKMRRNISNTGW
jgi:arylamine N-acetyltransferase